IYGSGLLLCARRATPEHRHRRFARLTFATLSIGWALVSGLAGCFLIFTLTTDHQAAHHNQNILLFTPIALLLLAFAPSAVRRRRFAVHARYTSLIVLGLAFLSVIINMCLSPRQMNWDLVALAMPIYIAWAIALWWLCAGQSNRRNNDPKPGPVS